MWERGRDGHFQPQRQRGLGQAAAWGVCAPTDDDKHYSPAQSGRLLWYMYHCSPGLTGVQDLGHHVEALAHQDGNHQEHLRARIFIEAMRALEGFEMACWPSFAAARMFAAPNLDGAERVSHSTRGRGHTGAGFAFPINPHPLARQ
jgi:hypothetical protein